MSLITSLARPEIAALAPYESAAWEPGLARLHANELPWDGAGDGAWTALNRYPEPQPRALRAALAQLYAVAPEQILVGRGSDEGIDLLVRTFCRAGMDAVLTTPPTFGMYGVAARIQGARVVTVPLEPGSGFRLDAERLLASCSADVKLVFLCSPNNPTGNLLAEDIVLAVADALAQRALVVVDEAYVEFSGRDSLARHLGRVSNLAVLRTLSKAWGLAGARCGALLGSRELIALLRRIIMPYALSQPTIERVLAALEPAARCAAQQRIAELVRERERLGAGLQDLECIRRVWPSDANFVLAEFTDAAAALAHARAAGILVRDVRSQPGLASSLRITVGTPEQNRRLLEAWRS